MDIYIYIYTYIHIYTYIYIYIHTYIIGLAALFVSGSLQASLLAP